MATFLLRIAAVLALAALAVGYAAEVPPPSPNPTAPAADKAEAAKGNTAFALDLYAKLRTREGNLFLSPASISTALAMTYAGARGTTADEMAKVLHFTLEPDRLHPAQGALLAGLRGGQASSSRVEVANALWAQKGHPFLSAFVTIKRDDYGAALHGVDFVGAAPEAARAINAWVARQTQDKIKDLVGADDLDANTRLVLTNAVYFKAAWQSPFSRSGTHDASFHVTAREDVTVPLMHKAGHFRHLAADDFQALELPYAGGGLSMVVFLPKKVDGLADFEKRLTAANLGRWLEGLADATVVVGLPRFKVSGRLKLKDTLSSLGMASAFASGADFSGMDGTKELFISAVTHEAFVDVTEQGTEAAAATKVVITKDEGPREELLFVADHPFVFLIRDRRSGSILFLGRLVNPR
jgi:serpin B